jgi:hypothetical protein
MLLPHNVSISIRYELLLLLPPFFGNQKSPPWTQRTEFKVGCDKCRTFYKEGRLCGYLPTLPRCPGGALQGHRHLEKIFNCWYTPMFTYGLLTPSI